MGESHETLTERSYRASSSPQEESPGRRVIPIVARADATAPKAGSDMTNSCGDAADIPENGEGGVFQLNVTALSIHAMRAFLGSCTDALIVRHRTVRLPGSIIDDLRARTVKPYTRFRIQVNDTLRSTVCVEWFATSGLLARAFVLLYWAANCVAYALLSATGMRPHVRVGRFFSRKLQSTLALARRRLWGDAERVSTRLNQYVLTDRLHELQEFRFPSGLHIALTKNCNLKCVMCPYHADDLRTQHSTRYFATAERMPAELLTRIIQEAGQYGANLSFGQYDEPFIYKGFAGWIAKAKAAGCTVSITTNGTLLTETDAQTLLKAGVEHISFSLDAASAESYREIRLDDFEVPIANLRRLVKMRNAGGYRTQIRACMVVQEQNRHERHAFLALMREIGLDVVSFYNLSVLDKGIWITPVLNFDVEHDTAGHRSVCSQLYNQMAIYPDGRVALCCLTTMYVGYREDVPYVGNVAESSLRDIWISQGYTRIRREAFANKFSNSVCQDCTIWHNFQNRESIGPHGFREFKNAYETFVYLR